MLKIVNLPYFDQFSYIWFKIVVSYIVYSSSKCFVR